MAEIRAIQIDRTRIANVLDVAVLFPDALRYLLELGADANLANDFGKTPLMYAAQYNQYESAELLLSHGADPNAATVWPNDKCFYTLTTSRMTPLHYAARYASIGVTRLLLSRGALTFNRTDTGSGAGDTPLDWLKRYTGPEAEERNVNLPAGDITTLEAWLRVPRDAELLRISADLTRRAQGDYNAGRIDQAYRQLVSALSADPENRAALGDLPLVALRTGRLGLALEAADGVRRQAADPASRAANAWFNTGLACEQYGRRFLSYNGRYYCTGDPVRPFLQAWRLGPSPDRRNKLQQLLQAEQPGTCSVAQDRSPPHRYRFEFTSREDDTSSRQVQRIYVYHAAALTVDPAAIHWTISLFDIKTRQSTPTTVVPRQVERYELGDFAITELEAEFMAQGPVSIGGQTCHPYD